VNAVNLLIAMTFDNRSLVHIFFSFLQVLPLPMNLPESTNR